MNRLVEQLDRARTDGRLLLSGYLPAGFPAGGFTACIREAFEAGIDAMEVALPNPPSMIDGPLIRRAVEQGSRMVEEPAAALRQSAEGRVHPTQAIVVLAYREAFDELGAEGLLRQCVEADADAVLLPQHSMDEQLAFARRARDAGLEQVVFLYLQDDLVQLAESDLQRPVIYLQSSDQATGGEFNADKAIERLGEVREAFGDRDAYVLVGFGIRGADEVAMLSGSGADGVIVGTAVVEAASNGAGAVGSLVRSIQPALLEEGSLR